MPRIEINTHGALFSEPRQRRIVDNLCKEVEQETAEWAENRVHEMLHEVLRHPTGYYESKIQTDRTTTGWEVNDGGVIYGPWLEGTGSRNNTTRFKGYHTFRTVAQEVEQRSDGIAEDVLDRGLWRL
jgi:hypothetical protein